MKILLVAAHFPPENVIASVRTSRIADHLLAQENDIRVITCKSKDQSSRLATGFPVDRTISTSWLDLGAPVNVVFGSMQRVRDVRAKIQNQDSRGSLKSFLLKKCSDFYRNIFFIPDRFVGWLPSLWWHTFKVTRRWRPDVILVSASPFSSVLGVSILSRFLRIPYVVDVRDLWTQNPYYGFASWRAFLDKRLERVSFSKAAAFITIGEGLKQELGKSVTQPISVVYSGYEEIGAQKNVAPSDDLCITYAGMIYGGKRDPSPLFRAIALSKLKNIAVTFYTEQRALVSDLAQESNIPQQVHCHPKLDYHEVRKIMRRSDVLLLLLWNDPREKHSLTGKVFDYIAARRPILILGAPKSGELRSMLGGIKGIYFLDDVEELAWQLKEWTREKEAGGIADVDITPLRHLERTHQMERINNILSSFSSSGSSFTTGENRFQNKV